MRANSGPRFWWVSLFPLFFPLGFPIWLIALPLYALHTPSSPPDPTWWDLAGFLFYAIELTFEINADSQLPRFRAGRPKQMRVLRRVCGHRRNILISLATPTSGGASFVSLLSNAEGFLTLPSPVLMTWRLLCTSGVSFLEDTISQCRLNDDNYAKTTNAFFPRPVKRTIPDS